ncbi:XrtA/PEP-CTERM system TPR-repeat protein PrsT [Thalassotalea sediminis]|uniref:XrtA/PEP-CTERM system TPR-repeat protein PrsT n=1 Tax=Thalassotalea sediminis TaxID=1759089 RepID=UPI002572E06A|nr:XrtA/PEP-CTERM system TPR-repeat protein PrsT [Thalassotalea sediminis]
MRSRYLGFVSVILMCLCSTGFANSLENYEAAERAFQAHEYGKAETYLKNLLSQNNKNTTAQLLLIKVYLAQGKGHLAESELQNAGNIGIDTAESKLLYAQAYTQQGLYNKSLDALKIAENNPAIIDQVYVARGLAQIGLGHFNVAKRTFEQALRVNSGNLNAKLGLAQVHIIDKKEALAHQILDEVLDSYLPPLKALSMKANLLYQQAELIPALALVNQVLSESNNDFSSLLLRASIYIEQQRFSLADEDLEIVLNQLPNEPRATFLKAVVASSQNRDEVSERVVNNVFEIIGNIAPEVIERYPSYLYLASYAAFMQGELEHAKTYLNRYLAIDATSYRALRLSASIDYALGNYMIALATLKKANLAYPNDAAINSLLGTIYLALDNDDKALFYFEHAKSLASDFILFDLQLAQALIANDKANQAAELLVNIAKKNRDEPKNLQLIEPLLFKAYVMQRKFEQAFDVSKRIVAHDPTVENLYQQGLILLELGKIDAAIENIDNALSVDPRFIPAVIAKANILAQQHDVEQAIRYTEAVYKDKNDAQLAFSIAQFYQQNDQLPKSAEKLAQAYELAPENFEITKAYITLLYRTERQKKALDIAEGYLKKYADNLPMYYLLADLYLAQNSIDKAHQVLKDAFRLNLKDIEKSALYRKVAAIYGKTLNAQGALDALQKALAWHPASPSLLALAKYYQEVGRIDESIKVIENYQDSIVSDEITLLYAQNLLAVGKYKAAAKHFRDIDDIYPAAQVGLVQTMVATEKSDQAIKYLTERIEQHPKHPLLMLTKAELLANANDWQAAFDIYQTILSFYKDATVYNNAAYSALQLGNLAEAKQLAEKSLTLQPKQPNTLDTLGLILSQMQRYQDALPYYRQALVVNKNRPDIKFHLAKTLEALDRDREAMSLLADIVNSNVYFAEKEAAKGLLDKLIVEQN